MHPKPSRLVIQYILALAFATIAVGQAHGQTATFVGSDTTTQGNWQGVYGGDGYDIAQDSQNIPSYASFSVSGGSLWTWGSGLSYARALETNDSSNRLAACWYNAYSFSMNVNFTDNNTHQFAFYAIDWDQSNRAETIQIVSAATNAQLDQRSISGFQNGIWMVWNISGNVIINITTTSNADSNAVVSGVFFGSAGSGGSINVTVSPTSVDLSDSQTQQFSATVTGTSNEAVTWSISPSVGTISSSGLYTAPGTITTNQTVTVTATSQADNTTTGTASVVLTGGATATFVTSDTMTEGSWQGTYGSDGYSLAQDSQSLPSYATFSVSSESNWTWGSGLTNMNALQTNDSSNRLAACWYSASSFTLNVNFTDGNTHQFAIYAVDWQSFGLNETFQVRDSVTNDLLDTRTISSFQSGVYLVWNISGHVIITVTNNAYPNAVVSGVFFGGNGSGSITVNVNPSSVSLSASQAQQFSATVTGTSNTAVTWSISPNVGSISGGLYTAPATIASNQTITVTATSVANASKSGTAAVSLTAGATATFLTLDTSTQGTWHNNYGADGYSVSQDSQSLPSYAAFSVSNNLNWVWASSTTDPRALQTGSGSGRIAACWYSVSTFNMDVNFTDGNSHQFALYAIDWDSRSRAETIQIVDANTLAVLDTRSISSFVNGDYLVWNIFGHVKINVTVTGGDNGVVSGVFFGGSSNGGGGGQINVSVSPSSATLSAGQTQQFTATVTGTSNTSVSWTINPSVGSISSGGLYTAPGSIATAQTVAVTATSEADMSATGTATVNLTVSSTGPTVYYYIEDMLGTSRVITNSAGNVCYDADFTPYGYEIPISNSCSQNYKFTGKERDSESGLDNFGARYNSSQYGRFMSPDPAGIFIGNLEDPQQLNLYSYVRNNPLSFIDPSGLDCVYLNDAGTGIADNGVDTNSNQQECEGTNHQNGGFWVNGTVTSVGLDPNSNDVALHGYDESGLTNSFYNSSGTSSNSPSDAASLPPNVFPFNPNQPLPANTLGPMIHSLNRSGQSDKVIGCIVAKESSGRPGVQSATSSARGLMGIETGANGTGDIARAAGGTFGGMTGTQLYSQLADPAINIAAGSTFVGMKIGYAHGNVQNGLDMYGTGSPYGQQVMKCAQ